MICVISQINYITGSNPKFIRIGFFVVKNVGILFLNMMTILMVEQESKLINNPANLISKPMKLVKALNLIKLN